jgi:pyruvate,orthophosphate dikinase
MGVEKGHATRPDLKTGVCGEHGGDPESIATFYAAGVDYVSCSPFRVPVARLAAAQAVLTQGARPGAATAAKKAPAKKRAVSKRAAKKTPAKKTPAKKAPAKKAAGTSR